jgi:hypothetical protein
MKKVYILASMLLMGQSSWAQIREFQTTRLNSTAGAGVASVLSTEAALLNPATAAFFNGSSFSYHNTKTSLRHESKDRGSASDDFASRNKSQGFFMADHTGPVKGGLSYIQQDENDFERTQISMHTAAAMGANASAGISYRYIQDVNPPERKNRKKTHHQFVFGTLFVLDEDTTVGLTLIDPSRTTPGEERALAGLQYNIADKLTLIADIGTQYTKDVKDKHLWRAALQLTIFDDFFFRAGKFYDNIREFKGTGWGVGWVGPRLGVEFAQRFSQQFGENSYIYQDESLVDTSISAIIKF